MRYKGFQSVHKPVVTLDGEIDLRVRQKMRADQGVVPVNKGMGSYRIKGMVQDGFSMSDVSLPEFRN